MRVWFRLQLLALLSWFNPYSKEVERTKSGGLRVRKENAGPEPEPSHRLEEAEAAEVISGEQARASRLGARA